MSSKNNNDHAVVSDDADVHACAGVFAVAPPSPSSAPPSTPPRSLEIFTCAVVEAHADVIDDDDACAIVDAFAPATSPPSPSPPLSFDCFEPRAAYGYGFAVADALVDARVIAIASVLADVPAGVDANVFGHALAHANVLLLTNIMLRFTGNNGDANGNQMP